MHGNVGALLIEGDLELFDEQPLAADGGKTAVLNTVALGDDGHELNLETGVCPTQQRRDMLGLPEGKLALTRGDAQRRSQRHGHLGVGFSGNSADFSR